MPIGFLYISYHDDNDFYNDKDKHCDDNDSDDTARIIVMMILMMIL